ncbi:MAG TPA: nickel-dependent lactate racemase [Thermomicrobiaceae bacterium]|nr:nickel-dependent lactate racemase [Thermomicrobiaceae bacterium]
MTRGATRRVTLPYGNGEVEFTVPARARLTVVSPHPVAPSADPAAEVRRALTDPIGAPRLHDAARGTRSVVILADDLTRQTPVDVIIPGLLEELSDAGIRDEQITVLIALGTHRPMTEPEIAARFGAAVTGRVAVVNNPWDDLDQLVDLGITPNGTPILVSRIAYEADFLIGLGSIVPHHIPGYSAGAKIVQPGVSGAATTGATHFLSTRTRRSYLGLVDNPVRAEMERIAEQVGLSVVLNTVLDHAGRLVRAFFGDPRRAWRAGVALSREVYGAALPGPADVVVAGSHPCDIEFWQAHKSLYPADIAVRDGGTIVVVTPSPEGVSVTHHDMLAFTALDAARIEALIEAGTLGDVVSGALALAWARIRERADVSLVSGGISDDEARALCFTPYVGLQEAVDAALRRHGSDAAVTVLTHAPEMLPLLPG